MKNLLLCSMSCMLTTLLFAQPPQSDVPIAKYTFSEAEALVKKQSPTPRSQRSNIWSEDFSNGFDSPNGTWTTGGEHGHVWEYTTEIQSGCWSGAANNTVQMTTRENGFMLFHADDFNCIDPGPPILIEETPLEGELISPSIDLSEYPAVLLTFEHWFRHCCNAGFEVWVSVSNDGGDTWTNYDVTANTPTFSYNENNQARVYISTAAANQSDVLIKFVWNATGSSSLYFWAIDDITLEIPPDNDMVIDGDPEYTTYNDDFDFDYSIYEINQIRPLTFSISAFNLGMNDQTGVHLEITVSDGEGYESIFTSESTVVPHGETASFTAGPYTPPPNPGNYTVTYTIRQDQEDDNPDNNIATYTFAISDGEFARDRGALENIANLGFYDFYAGSMFWMTDEGAIHCIGGALANTSTIGAVFSFELRSFSATGLDMLGETETGIVSEDMLNEAGGNNFSYLWLQDGPFPVEAGDHRVPMFRYFQGADPVYIGISGNTPGFSSYVYAEYEIGCAPCYVNLVFMVRLGMSNEFCEAMIGHPNSVASIEKVNIYELYPNPTRGITTIEYSLLENNRVLMFLFDMNGRIVYSNDLGVVGAGDYRHELDFSNLAAGTYTFSIKVNDKHETKQVMIR